LGGRGYLPPPPRFAIPSNYDNSTHPNPVVEQQALNVEPMGMALAVAAMPLNSGVAATERETHSVRQSLSAHQNGKAEK
jgi:hypothetical protein